jgi:hypothetical protein
MSSQRRVPFPSCAGLSVRNLVPKCPVISQHDLNPELEVANPGIIEKAAPRCGTGEVVASQFH